MYPLSSDGRAVYTAPYRQVALIDFAGIEEALILTEKDIVEGGLKINRYSTSGSRIEIGSVIAAEAQIELDNSDGRFNNTRFEGAKLYIRVGAKKWDADAWENAAVQYVPMGYYTIDEAPRKREKITLTALDRMMLFDKEADLGQWSFPMTVSSLLTHICNDCNVSLSSGISGLPNSSYTVVAPPESENMTYRQVLSWIAEITGTCAFFDWNGQLTLKWYSDTGMNLTPSERFESDLEENEIVISGVQIIDGENIYLAGDDSYPLSISDNLLIQQGYETVAQNLYETLAGFAYVPFSATVQPMPWLYPLDIISFVTLNGESVQTIITDFTFTINGNTVLEGKGETATRDGYAAINPLTQREMEIIRRATQKQNEKQNDYIRAVLSFNELISHSLGLYNTAVTQEDGSVVYYMHDRETLETSRTIFTQTAAGMAYTTTGWNNGSPVWEYGVTAAGDALFRMLSAQGITVSAPSETYTTLISPSSFEIQNSGATVAKIDGDRMTVPRLDVTGYVRIGNIRIEPYGDEGMNIHFVQEE